MRASASITAVAGFSIALMGRALAEDSAAWSMTLYAGPATNNYASQIFHGEFHIEGPMGALAFDRELFNFGAGFRLVGEAQLAHYFFQPPTTTVGLGVGLKYDRLSFGPESPVAVALYLGPSYSFDPPGYLLASGAIHRFQLLNYLSSETTVGLPGASRWQISFRTFHRSGMYGIYARDVDEGTTVAVGIRHTF